ncbi:hypothetical protein J7L81_02340 [Candidatus Aerophobetes bacterium]|uniref:Uncharacterized protein n=1 Tax=Aerophobetes bacterium TaxID=2030807 RepID=A0A7V5HXV9_UNCAE|nr:hypothetical protein [Candidatus Aerophobetes bacterium]HHF97940.1 hypothetical protein [Candidatus Aerophobetes bacterium]
MIYTEEFFSVSFADEEEKIEENPVPYGKPCRTDIERTRYVGIARIRRLEPQIYRLEGVTIIILPGKDKVTEEKKRKITSYAQTLAARRYAKILRGNFPIEIDPKIYFMLQDVALWVPSKGLVHSIEEIIEDMLSF